MAVPTTKEAEHKLRVGKNLVHGRGLFQDYQNDAKTVTSLPPILLSMPAGGSVGK
jgi:hypothetical protein